MENTSFRFTDYEKIFKPKRMAIVGISSKGKGAACDLFYSLQSFGYEGEIIFVNPKGGELAGKPILKSIEEIPGQIDLAAIFVKASAVPSLLEACRQKGATAAEVFSSGFKEINTEEGITLEKQITQVSEKGIRVIGPNCMGIYCPEGGLTIVPGPDFSQVAGSVAFISQSGGQAIDFVNEGKSIGLTFSKVVNFGNGADLRETELLEYLGQDDATRIINMYMEGVSDGDRFVRVFKHVSAKKPVIVLKGGLSEAGGRAVLSHTASMGGSRKIWQSIFDQVNAVQVWNIKEMASTSLAFSCLPIRSYKRLSIITGGGGMGVAGADAAEVYDLEVPPFTSEVAQAIDALLPKPGSSAANPVDMAIPFAPPKMIIDTMSLAATDKNVDLQILVTMFSYYIVVARAMGKPLKDAVPYNEIADGISDVAQKTDKPVVVVLTNFRRGIEDMEVVEMMELARKAFIERNIAVFDSLSDAMQAINHVNYYYGGKSNE